MVFGPPLEALFVIHYTTFMSKMTTTTAMMIIDFIWTM